jgi:hypothetical protein
MTRKPSQGSWDGMTCDRLIGQAGSGDREHRHRKAPFPLGGIVGSAQIAGHSVMILGRMSSANILCAGRDLATDKTVLFLQQLHQVHKISCSTGGQRSHTRSIYLAASFQPARRRCARAQKFPAPLFQHQHLQKLL